MNTVSQELYSKIRQFVFGKVKKMEDAEDIVQEVFIKAQLKSFQLDDVSKLTAWLYGITKNSIIDYYRQKKKWAELSLPVTEEEEYNRFNDCIEQCLHDLISTLPSSYREALVLTEMQNLSQKELAKRLSISYSGAKSRVQRARQMLKEKINKFYKIETDRYGNIIYCACSCNLT